MDGMGCPLGAAAGTAGCRTRHEGLSAAARRVSATVLVTVLREVVWPSKSETGGFGGMVGSPNFHHKPPEPGYIDVVQQTQNVTPKYKGVGGWGKRKPRRRGRRRCPGLPVLPAGEAQGRSLN